MDITTDQLWNDFLSRELERMCQHERGAEALARAVACFIGEVLDHLEEKRVRVRDINNNYVDDALVEPDRDRLCVTFQSRYVVPHNVCAREQRYFVRCASRDLSWIAPQWGNMPSRQISQAGVFFRPTPSVSYADTRELIQSLMGTEIFVDRA